MCAHGISSQEVHEAHGKQSQRCHGGVQPGELERRGACCALAVEPGVHSISAGGRASGGARRGCRGVDLVRHRIGCAALVILLASSLTGGVAIACYNALADIFNADEVGKCEGIFGGIRNLSVIAEAIVREAGLEGDFQLAELDCKGNTINLIRSGDVRRCMCWWLPHWLPYLDRCKDIAASRWCTSSLCQVVSILCLAQGLVCVRTHV